MIEALIQQLTEAQHRKLIRRLEVYPREPQKDTLTTVFVTLNDETPQTVRDKFTETLETKYACKVRVLAKGIVLIYKEPRE